jgi:two-component system, cell cycle sensor histidine kinase and response regulator CckA
VYSEVGRDSAFHVLIPASTELEPEPPPQVTPQKGRGELLLFVDDEAVIRETAGDLLRQRGYDVITAANGQQALLEVSAHGDRIKLMITDVVMPVMDGLTLIRIAKGVVPHIAIIATSGLAHDEQRRELAEVGIADVLHKPFAPNEILKAVAATLAKSRSGDWPASHQGPQVGTAHGARMPVETRTT